MSLQPTASRTALLLLCPRPFDPELADLPDDADEPARYGSAFHALIASCLRSKGKAPYERSAAYVKEVDRTARRYDVRLAAAELAGHVKSSVQVFRKWLEREKLQIIEIEQAHAIHPRAKGFWQARRIRPHDEGHCYSVDPGEVPGTVDVIAANDSRTRTVVVDHKTGGEEDWHHEGANFALPASLAQMRTLGLVGGGDNDTRGYMPDIEVGIFHADRRGLPMVYTEPYERPAQKKHVAALFEALSHVGYGFLRPGPHCTRCPKRETCPGYSANLIDEGTVALVKHAMTFGLEPVDPRALHALPDDSPLAGASLEERAGALYELLKRFEALAKGGREELRRLVRAGKVIETSEGKVLGLREQTFETLSKKSVLEALGPIAGERELKRLRAKGAIREATREMLVGEK